MRIEWHGLSRRIPLAGHIALRHGPLFNRPDRLAIRAIEHVEQRLFGWLGDRFDSPSLDRDVGEDRRAREIVVPETVVNRLEVPHALSRPRIQRHHALRKQIGAFAQPAVPVVGRRRLRQIDMSKLFVAAHRAPDVRVAAIGPGTFEPRIVADLSRTWDRVPEPQLFAGSDIDPADVARRHRLVRYRRRAVDIADHRANDDDTPNDHRRSGAPGECGHPSLLAFAEIDLAAVAEIGIALAGLGVQRGEIAAADQRDDAFVTAVRPVGEARVALPARGRPLSGSETASGARSGRRRINMPHHLAGGGVSGDTTDAV